MAATLNMSDAADGFLLSPARSLFIIPYNQHLVSQHPQVCDGTLVATFLAR
jgi:hypothetical protein